MSDQLAAYLLAYRDRYGRFPARLTEYREADQWQR